MPQSVPNGFGASIDVDRFFLFAPKTDFGARLGTFWARAHRGGEVQGGENAEIGHFGESP
jgi:hypothetical protein